MRLTEHNTNWTQYILRRLTEQKCWRLGVEHQTADVSVMTFDRAVAHQLVWVDQLDWRAFSWNCKYAKYTLEPTGFLHKYSIQLQEKNKKQLETYQEHTRTHTHTKKKEGHAHFSTQTWCQCCVSYTPHSLHVLRQGCLPSNTNNWDRGHCLQTQITEIGVTAFKHKQLLRLGSQPSNTNNSRDRGVCLQTQTTPEIEASAFKHKQI